MAPRRLLSRILKQIHLNAAQQQKAAPQQNAAKQQKASQQQNAAQQQNATPPAASRALQLQTTDVPAETSATCLLPQPLAL